MFMKGTSSSVLIGVTILIIAVVIAVFVAYYLSMKYGSLTEGLKSILPNIPFVSTQETKEPYSKLLVDSYGCDLRTFSCPELADYCTYTFSVKASADCPQSGRLEKGENYMKKTGCSYTSFASNNQCRMLAFYNTGINTPSQTTTPTTAVTTTIPAEGATTTTTPESVVGGIVIYKSSEPVSSCWYGGCNKVTDQLASPWCCPVGYARCIVEFSVILKELTPDSGVGHIKSTKPNYCIITGYT